MVRNNHKPKQAKQIDGTDLKPYLLSLKEAAFHLCVGYDQILLMVQRNELPTITIGKRQRIPRKKLEEYIDVFEGINENR